MKVKSHVHSMMRGSVAGITYSANRYSAIIARNRTIPVQPNTTYQQIMRSALSWASAAWDALTDGQRHGWDDYASTVTLSGPQGEYTPTGRDMFIAGTSLHHYALLRGLHLDQTTTQEPEFDGLLTFTDVPEYTYDVGPPEVSSINITIHNLNDEDCLFLVQRSLFYSTARYFHKGPWMTKNVAALQIDAGDNDSFSLVDCPVDRAIFFRIRAVVNQPGPPAAGHRISAAAILRVSTETPPV
jgi:hypothetical protein